MVGVAGKPSGLPCLCGLQTLLRSPPKGTGMQETDWHKADILAALKKKKISMAGLSREHGLSDGTLLNALNRNWPRGELIIANAIGVTPQEIWPSRYFENDGSPINRVIRKPI